MEAVESNRPEADEPVGRPRGVDVTVVSFAVLGLSIILLVLVGNYWLPTMSDEYSVDASYRHFMNAAVGGPYAYGPDIVFTHGPLGFLAFADVHPFATPLRLVINTICAATAISLYAYLFTPPGAMRSPLYLLAVVGSVLLILATNLLAPLMLYSGIVMLLAAALFGAPYRTFPGCQEMLLLLAAVAAFSKFSNFGLSLAIVGLFATYDAVRNRRIPWILPKYLAILAVVWMAAGQPLLALPDFVLNNFHLSSQYGSGIAQMGPRDQEVALLALFVVIGLGMSAAIFYTMWRRDGWWAAIPTLAFGAFIYGGMKVGFVQYSTGHLEQGFLILSLLAFVVGIAIAPLLEGKRKGIGLGAFLAVPFVALMGIQSWVDQAPWNRILGIPQKVMVATGDIGTILAQPTAFQKLYDEGFDRIRAQNPIPQREGTYDIFPDNQTLLLANRLDYSPRPAFEAIITVSTRLMDLNIAHMRSEKAADNILYYPDNSDGRLPAIVDGQLLPELWTRYDVDELAGRSALLKRRETPGSYRMEVIREETIGLLDPWVLPDFAGPVWVKAEIRLSALGRLAAFLYKIPPIRLEVTTYAGHKEYGGVVAAVAEGGFLLSPTMNATSEFMSVPDLAMNGLAPSDSYRVKQAQILDPGIAKLLYESEIHIVYERIVIERPDPFYAPVGAAADQSAIVAAILRNASAPNMRTINVSHEGNTIPAIRSAGAFKATGSAPAGATGLSFIVHIDGDAGPKADEGFKPTPDGIDVAVVFRDAGGAELERQAHTIDPSLSKDVRDPTRITFSAPSGAVQFEIDVSERTNGAYDSASFYDFQWAQ